MSFPQDPQKWYKWAVCYLIIETIIYVYVLRLTPFSLVPPESKKKKKKKSTKPGGFSFSLLSILESSSRLSLPTSLNIKDPQTVHG